ncbi:DNAJ domain protein [Castilleja foliolosa]|uniref:DNAJ domain protein n=1 Tax=Castilleja foliolosa TaxID=1961234 RepID=A0ABD3DGK5_9LAMI
MGGLCSRSSTDDTALSGALPHVNGRLSYGSGIIYQSRGLDVRENNNNDNISADVEITNRELREPFSFPELNATNLDDINDGIPRLSRALSDKSRSTRSKQVAIAKVSEVSSLLGRAGTVSLGKAVDVLDTLGSSMTNLNLSSGFASGIVTKGISISILAFEVANTIVKGANLINSLSHDNIQHLKETIIPSEGIQRLISRDIDELLSIAASDKRDELKIFAGEVIRFGNRCKDPQWHNLDRYFEKLESELMPHKQLKETAEADIQQLMMFVQYTALQELYHEMHALDRFEQDCRRKAQEEANSNATQKGDSLAILRAELKSQKKHVKSLKKKSLWSKILEEVMEKLVDIVHFIHLEINSAFGNSDVSLPLDDHRKKLGSAGLSLHYANIINQIDTLSFANFINHGYNLNQVTRSSSVPPSTRDALYQGLPPGIKSALRTRLQSFQLNEELTAPQIKAEMEKTLHWLVPMATNTTKLHHGFGWVGEWANTGSEMNRQPAGPTDLLRIETLHHADKEKTESHILDLVVWLHHLISQTRAANGSIRSPVKSPIRSPNQKMFQLSCHKPNSPSSSPLSVEDQEMLRDVSKRKLTPGISKSQEFGTSKARLCKHHRLSKSSSHSAMSENKWDPFPIRRQSFVPVINFDIDRSKALDVIDRVDSI